MGQKKQKDKKQDEQWDSLYARVEYLCELVFGGNWGALGRHIGMSERWLQKVGSGKNGGRLLVLVRLVQRGLVNAEWLLAGTGPVRPCDDHLPIDLPPPTETQFPLFDTRRVRYQMPEITTPVALKPGTLYSDELEIARQIYAARKHDKPVVLFLGPAAIINNVGGVVVEMMRRGYVTGVALSSMAAERDYERALFGGWSSTTNALEAYNALLNAATMAASNGLGWGLAIGRWCFPTDSDRGGSVIASAYELNVPVTVHLNLGDCLSHLFPSLDGAARGAALGAASYLDLLTLAEQVSKVVEDKKHPGACLYTDDDRVGARLFCNAIEAVTAGYPHETVTQINGEYRHTFPSLLAACDAVYDGSADDGR